MRTIARSHDPLIRFQSRIIKDKNECWIWQGKIAANGRAVFRVNGRSVYVSKWAYEHYKGPTPEGLVLDRLCQIPACVNPDHLEAVTRLENNRRMRTHCRNGHYLTEETLTSRRMEVVSVVPASKSAPRDTSNDHMRGSFISR